MTVKIEKIKQELQSYKYCLCIWTDKTDFLKDNNLPDADKLLEIRCFDENGEFYAYRSNISKDFTAREITDDNVYDGYFDEEHYLDVDTTKGITDGNVKATGGGSYYLPVENAEKIIVRFFYKFDCIECKDKNGNVQKVENGIARKCDMRLVGFVEGGKEQWDMIL